MADSEDIQNQILDALTIALAEAKPFFDAEGEDEERARELILLKENPADAFGLAQEDLDYIAGAGERLLQGKHYREAQRIFTLLAELKPDSARAWRGLGLAARRLGETPLMMSALEQAISLDPSDALSALTLAEAELVQGIEGGRDRLQAIAETAAKDEMGALVRVKAKALLARIDGQVLSLEVVADEASAENARQEKAQWEASLAGAQSQEEEASGTGSGEGGELHWEHARKNPKLAAKLEELAEAWRAGNVELATLGGISDEELDAAYRVAARFAEMEDWLNAMQLCSVLLLLKPEARFAHLMGVCFQRQDIYPWALEMFEFAEAEDHGQPATRCLMGECLLRLGRRDEALPLLQEVADGACAHLDPQGVYKKRATALLQAFST